MNEINLIDIECTKMIIYPIYLLILVNLCIICVIYFLFIMIILTWKKKLTTILKILC